MKRIAVAAVVLMALLSMSAFTAYVPLVATDRPVAATMTQAPSTATPTAVATMTVELVIDYLDGVAFLSSHDGETYLGLVSSDCYGADSIVNESGTYGSPYSSTSINNPYGVYGSAYSNTSAFNSLATEPPVIWDWDGQTYYPFCYLTTNSLKRPFINSEYMLAYLRWKGGCD